MIPDPEDTIVGLSSAAGPGGRAVIRLSGAGSLAAALHVFRPEGTHPPTERGIYPGRVEFPGLVGRLPVDLYLFNAPASYTGQTVVELHVISSSPLVQSLLGELYATGARAAQPGEFTLRAFLAGKMDLARAESVLGVIEAGSRSELRQSLRQLAGGVSRPLSGLRDDLLDLLADLEAGLDFVAEDIEFVGKSETLTRLARGLAAVTLVQRQLDERGLGDRPFRVALFGPPNAGKSSLFNALTGSGALVSPVPGTTRDYLVARLDLGGAVIELIDTAGIRPPDDEVDKAAQALGSEVANEADLILHCVEASAAGALTPANSIRVATKADLADPPHGILATSAVTGHGLDELRTVLARNAAAHFGRGLAPSLSRCAHHVAACLESLRRAYHGVLFGDPPEVVASDLREALEQLGAVTGAVHTDDLLDRVFSRFCIGK